MNDKMVVRSVDYWIWLAIFFSCGVVAGLMVGIIWGDLDGRIYWTYLIAHWIAYIPALRYVNRH